MKKKKYSVSWSVFNLISETQEQTSKLQMVWAGLSGLICGSTFIMSDDRHTLIAMIGSFVVDKLISCFYFEEIIENEPNS